MTKVITNHREKIFYILISIIVLLGLLYAALAHSMVHKMVVSEALVKSNRNKVAPIGQLEAQYIALKTSITRAVAVNNGFEEGKPIYMKEKAVARTFNEIR